MKDDKIELQHSNIEEEKNYFFKEQAKLFKKLNHELKTPLNSIIGFSNLLLKNEVDNKKAEYLLEVSGSAQEMLTKINNLILLSNLQMQTYSVNKSNFKLSKIIARIDKEFKNKKNNIEFNAEILESVPEYIWR